MRWFLGGKGWLLTSLPSFYTPPQPHHPFRLGDSFSQKHLQSQLRVLQDLGFLIGLTMHGHHDREQYRQNPWAGYKIDLKVMVCSLLLKFQLCEALKFSQGYPCPTNTQMRICSFLVRFPCSTFTFQCGIGMHPNRNSYYHSALLFEVNHFGWTRTAHDCPVMEVVLSGWLTDWLNKWIRMDKRMNE